MLISIKFALQLIRLGLTDEKNQLFEVKNQFALRTAAVDRIERERKRVRKITEFGQ